LASTLQADLHASSVKCYVAEIPLVTCRGIFFFHSPFVCTACIRFISSLQTVHTASVCLTSSQRSNDLFHCFFVLFLELQSYFNRYDPRVPTPIPINTCTCRYLIDRDLYPNRYIFFNDCNQKLCMKVIHSC